MGQQKQPAGKESQSKVKRICRAKFCKRVTRGTDLSKHYRSMTDFIKLKELQNMSKDSAEKIVKTVDEHTKFMVENGYTEFKMPCWKSHKPALKRIPDVFKVKTAQPEPESFDGEEDKDEAMEISERKNEDARSKFPLTFWQQ